MQPKARGGIQAAKKKTQEVIYKRCSMDHEYLRNHENKGEE